nr:MFS transporter [Sphingomonas tagetis]
MAGAYTVCAIDRFLMSIAVIPIKRDLALTDTQVGLLTGPSFAILYCVSGLFFGVLADRANRRNMITAGILAWSLATLLCALADDFPTLFLARTAVGLGEATLIPAVMSILPAIFKQESLGKAIGVFQTGVPMGKAIALIGGSALVGYLATHGELMGLADWQILFLVASVLGLPVALLMLTFEEPARNEKTGRGSLRSALAFARTIHSPLAVHCVAWTASLFVQATYVSWIPSFFVREHGMPIGAAGLMVGSLGFVGGAGGALLGGVYLDRLRRHVPERAVGMALATSLFLAIPAGLLMLLSASVHTAAIGYLLFVLVLTLGAPAGPAGIQLMVPERYRGTLTAGTYAMTSLVALMTGPLLVGILNDRIHTYDPALSLGVALMTICALGCLIGTVAGLMGRVNSS